jgi:predicted nucleic acid-binding protein
MKVIVDTSVWSLALRRDTEATSVAFVQELRHLIATQRAKLIGPVRQEILSGIRSKSQFESLRLHLESFPDIPLLTEDYVSAAEFFNTCRLNGVQGSNTDFLICAVASRNGFSIFTTDNDFTFFRKLLPITLHQ